MDYKGIHGEIKELDSGTLTKGVGFIGWASDDSWGGGWGDDRSDNDRGMNTEFEVRSQVHCVKATPPPQTSVCWFIDGDRWQPLASCSCPVGPGQ